MSDYNDKMIAEFRAHGGEVPAHPYGKALLLLHSTGAKSGEPRITPVAHFPDPDGWVIVASKGGAPENPAWYHNLLAHPDVEIEIGTETVPVHADVVDEGYDDVWNRVTERAPGFQDYKTKTERTIPLIRLTRR